MPGQSFRIKSQNPEGVQTHSNDRNNPFHFARQRWVINQKVDIDKK